MSSSLDGPGPAAIVRGGQSESGRAAPSAAAERLSSLLSGAQPENEAAGAAALVAGRIGNTPLFDLSHLLRESSSRLYAKAEFCNPGGSVKDRPALWMIRAALQQGRLCAGVRLLDATSGNTGIALAMLGAAFGIGVTLCLPRNASRERQRLLQAYGAEIVLTDPLEGSDGAIRRARELATDTDRYLYLDQYSNDANWRAHFESTGPEIWRQTNGTLTHFVAGLGTSGTFTGVGRFLRQHAPSVRLVSLQPDGPFHGLEGMKHMESAIVPPIYDPRLADDERVLSTEAAHQMAKRLAREHGLAVGVSAAANVATALSVAEQARGAVVVTILCDDAMKYLSDPFWDEQEHE